MRSARLPNYILRFITILFLQSASAQDYTQWGLPSGAIARLGKGSISGNIAYSPDGSRLAVACTSGIWLCDAETCQELSLIAGHTDEVSTVTFSPDGTMLASGGGNSEAHGRFDNTVQLWDAATGVHKLSITGHTDSVNSLAFSPDGSVLASASNDGTVLLWSVNQIHLRKDRYVTTRTALEGLSRCGIFDNGNWNRKNTILRMNPLPVYELRLSLLTARIQNIFIAARTNVNVILPHNHHFL